MNPGRNDNRRGRRRKRGSGKEETSLDMPVLPGRHPGTGGQSPRSERAASGRCGCRVLNPHGSSAPPSPPPPRSSADLCGVWGVGFVCARCVFSTWWSAHLRFIEGPALRHTPRVSFGEESRELGGVWADEMAGRQGGAPGSLRRTMASWAKLRPLGLEDGSTLLRVKPLTVHALTRVGGCAEDTRRGSHGGRGAGTQASCPYRPSGVGRIPVRSSGHGMVGWRH